MVKIYLDWKSPISLLFNKAYYYHLINSIICYMTRCHHKKLSPNYFFNYQNDFQPWWPPLNNCHLLTTASFIQQWTVLRSFLLGSSYKQLLFSFHKGGCCTQRFECIVKCFAKRSHSRTINFISYQKDNLHSNTFCHQVYLV